MSGNETLIRGEDGPPREIYVLYYFEPTAPTTRQYFYVGQSIQVRTRMRQHESASTSGHEDKYEFIRQLKSKGVEWHHEVLCTVDAEAYAQDTEHWHVIQLTRAGFRLTNMRHGSVTQLEQLARQVLSPRIRNVADVRLDREQAATRSKFVASKKLRRKVLFDTLKKHGIPDVRVDTVLPSIIRKRLLEDCAGGPYYVQAGLTVWDLVRAIRARPVIRRIQARSRAHQATLRQDADLGSGGVRRVEG